MILLMIVILWVLVGFCTWKIVMKQNQYLPPTTEDKIMLFVCMALGVVALVILTFEFGK